ncbi:MAG: MATE family efflux transporter [Candidatus Ancillula sp.]|jgi:putative MATE family efflux protein|nr:MATE family efflux transporter [Candidatus Ancillula sp.]
MAKRVKTEEEQAAKQVKKLFRKTFLEEKHPDKEKHAQNLSRRKISIAIILAALPVLIQNASGPLYVMFDSAVVGHFLGTEQLAGLNVGGSVVNAICGICVFISYLTNAQVSKAMGAGNRKGAAEYGRNGAYLAIILGLFFVAVMLVWTENIADFFSDDPKVIHYASLYLKAASPAILGILLTMASNGLLRGFKMFKIPMYIALAGGVLNVFLNILFVLILKMGIFGSGLATGIAMLSAGIVCFIIVMIKVHRENVSRKIDFKGLLEPLVDSIPFLIRTLVLWFAILMMTKSVAGVGANFEAAYQVINSLWAFEEIAIEAIEIPVQTFIAEQLGAKNIEKAKFILRCALRIGFVLAGILSLFSLVISPIAPFVFTSDPTVSSLATWGLVWNAFIFFHASFAFVMDGAFVAAEDTKFMAWMCVVSALIYLPFNIVLSPLIPNSGPGMFLALASYDVVFLGARALLALWRYRKDRWLKVALKA